MLNMMVGEVSPGGVGSGLYGMLILAILTVFLAGLMVGRTPEIYGKRLGRREITLVALYILTTPVLLLVGAGLTAGLPAGDGSITQQGPHGLSTALYAYASAANNNGSAFASFGAATTYQNTVLGLVMLFARFVPMVLVIAFGRGACQAEAEGARTGHPVDRRADVCWPAGGGGPVRRWSHLRPGARPGTCCGGAAMSTHTTDRSTFLDPGQMWRSLPAALRKLDPREVIRTPVMFVVWVGALFTTVLALQVPSVFAWSVAFWLWATVLFGTLAEAVAEGRGRAQAESLRKAREDTIARLLHPDGRGGTHPGRASARW